MYAMDLVSYKEFYLVDEIKRYVLLSDGTMRTGSDPGSQNVPLDPAVVPVANSLQNGLPIHP
jgi:hypothetical protein